MDELYGLRESHARAVRDGEPSRMIRKGWHSIIDGHMLTDEELAFAGAAPPQAEVDALVAAERERCAKVVDSFTDRGRGFLPAARAELATKIRSGE